VASSRARHRGAGVERTGGGSVVQISDRNMPILSCGSSPGSGANAGGGGGRAAVVVMEAGLKAVAMHWRGPLGCR
jgi:hypothetical protein